MYDWFTGRMPSTGLDAVRGVLLLNNRTGNLQCRIALQTAAIRPRNPSSPNLLETSYTASSRYSGVLGISTELTNKMWARFGVAYNLSSGNVPGQVDAILELSMAPSGKSLGTVVAQVFTPDTNSYFLPLTGWVPAEFSAKAAAAIHVGDSIGSFECRLAYRTATIEQSSPNAWSTTFDSWHSGNGSFNTGDLIPSTATAMWVQFGLQHNLTNGANGGANVEVTVAIRKA